MAQLAEDEGISWTCFVLNGDRFRVWDETAGDWRFFYEALKPAIDRPGHPASEENLTST